MRVLACKLLAWCCALESSVTCCLQRCAPYLKPLTHVREASLLQSSTHTSLQQHQCAYLPSLHTTVVARGKGQGARVVARLLHNCASECSRMDGSMPSQCCSQPKQVERHGVQTCLDRECSALRGKSFFSLHLCLMSGHAQSPRHRVQQSLIANLMFETF